MFMFKMKVIHLLLYILNYALFQFKYVYMVTYKYLYIFIHLDVEKRDENFTNEKYNFINKKTTFEERQETWHLSKTCQSMLKHDPNGESKQNVTNEDWLKFMKVLTNKILKACL